MPAFFHLSRGRLAALLLALLTSGAAFAISSDAEAVNKAGRQRMLSQRIALSYYMIGSQTNEQVAAQRTDAAIAEFHTNLQELRDYLGKDPETAALLAQEAALWEDYSRLAMSKPVPAQGLRMLQLSDQMLAACQKVVQRISTRSGSSIARLVDIAGRQRMISQRLGKYYFALMWKVADPQLDDSFQATLREFDSNLATLQKAPENTPAITAALKRVQMDWQLSKHAFDQYRSGRYVPFIIATTTESMLKSMDAITAQYVALAAQRR